jgi:hypothetical protein
MIKINYTKYTFSIPPCPSEVIYKVWKKTLPLVPNLDLEPKHKTFIQLNPVLKIVAKFLVISIPILTIIYIVFMELLSIFKPRGFFDSIYMLLTLIYFFIIIYFTISTISSYNSYRNYKSDSHRYYKNLKEIVLKSNNYSDFQLRHNAQFRNVRATNPTTYDKLNQKLDNLFDY